MKIYLALLCGILVSTVSNSQIANPRDVEYSFSTDTSKRVVELSELQLVLPKGAFPIIDYPAFVNEEEAREMFFEHEPVIAVEINNMAKAYPLAMLTRHEMTNDTLGGQPILPTYCPLCNASIVFDRRFDGRTLEFEVSGMLRKSDMVMFDRETETWWQQLMGYGIVGEYAGEYLDVFPSIVISVTEFFNKYPDGKILSSDTGTGSPDRYGTNPYVGYDSIGHDPYGRFFDPDDVDPRLPAMERVIDIEVDGKRKIYPWSVVRSSGVLHDRFMDMDLVLFHSDGMVSVMDKGQIRESRDIGSVTVFSPIVNGETLSFKSKRGVIYDKDTDSEWDITGFCINGPLKGTQLRLIPHGNHFAFAWLAFHPESEIYGQK